MTVIKNHFEVFLMTSKKQGNGIIESKIGLYSVHTYLSVKCQLWPSKDSVSGIVLWRPKIFGRHILDIQVKCK
jgi:hypothetical protein